MMLAIAQMPTDTDGSLGSRSLVDGSDAFFDFPNKGTNIVYRHKAQGYLNQTLVLRQARLRTVFVVLSHPCAPLRFNPLSVVIAPKQFTNPDGRCDFTPPATASSETSANVQVIAAAQKTCCCAVASSLVLGAEYAAFTGVRSATASVSR